MSNPYDDITLKIAEYVHKDISFSKEAYEHAKWALQDAIGCALLALNFPECTKILGPIVPNTVVPHGSRVIGTSYIVDPVTASFNIGSMIRWLDYNDTWLAKEWAHPSDNLGGILAVADFVSQNGTKMTMHDVLTALIKAYEIQGVLALSNSFNRVGLDHVILVKIATAAVVSKLLNGSLEQTLSALSNAWIDIGPLRTYRHAPNTGPRKSWAAGDATSRAVFLTHLAMKGEMGYPTALTAKNWGVQDVIFKGMPILLEKPLHSYVIENILFKISYPAEFHAQTAVEAAILLHPHVKDRLEKIERIEILTHESALRIIDKKGPLKNAADRDHCLQYMVAIALIKGNLSAEDYEEEQSQNPLIEQLRSKMTVTESLAHSKGYLDANKRSIANTLTLYLKDGSQVGPITIEYPLGHKRRRNEGLPLLEEKFIKNCSTRFNDDKLHKILSLFQNSDKLLNISVKDFINHLI